MIYICFCQTKTLIQLDRVISGYLLIRFDFHQFEQIDERINSGIDVPGFQLPTPGRLIILYKYRAVNVETEESFNK